MSIPQIQHFLDGKQIEVPVENFDINISARFPDDEIQPEIDTSEFTFVNEAAQQIYNRITQKGVFTGLPYKIQIRDANNTYTAFDGFLDLTNEFTGLSPVKVQAKLGQKSGRDTVEQRLEGLTVGFLENQGVFQAGDYEDIGFIIVKKKNFIEVSISVIVAYLMAKEIAESIQRIAKNVAEIAAYAGTGVTGPLVATLYSIALVLLDLAYTVAMIVNIINIAVDLYSTLIPSDRDWETPVPA